MGNDGTRPRVLVTGGTRGIGKSICREFARAGFDVAFTGRTLREGEGREEDEAGHPTPLAGSLEATRDEVEALGARALAIQLDLLDAASVDAGATPRSAHVTLSWCIASTANGRGRPLLWS